MNWTILETWRKSWAVSEKVKATSANKTQRADQTVLAASLEELSMGKGRIGNVIRGLPILVLTTKGRKTGLSRQNALMYLPQGKDFVVIAFNLGDEKHPACWVNLRAEPTASVQIADSHYTVRAREAEGDEREKLWQAIAEKNSDYEQYRTWTSRRIPVVILERR